MTDGGDSFSITAPAAGVKATALVFASPHSGDRYPDDMGAAPDLPLASLKSAEDALVGRLIAEGPRQGATLIEGRIGRAYLDLNRDPDELDPALIDGLDGPVGAKTAAGFGVVPRLAGDGSPLYARRMSLAEAQGRIDTVHGPYHQALGDLMETTRAAQGRAVLIDWHSMPARAVGAEVVLGDRYGSACGARLSRRLRELFEGLGWRVAQNHPYAGGWSTQRWGRPDDGYEAIQIELSRRLYLDEATLLPAANYATTQKALSRVIAALCADAWSA